MCCNNSDCVKDIGRGCCFGKDENGELEVKVCEGCWKLHVRDWLEEYPDNEPTDIVEVRFKNTRRSYYQNVNNLPLAVGDIVAVEASPGYDIGVVSLTGDMVARQMRRIGFTPMNGEWKKIYRRPKSFEIEKWLEAIGLEHQTMIRSRQIAAEMKLDMKIGDVEYQGDRMKAIFYYIADERVDFRELIKVFAEQFRVRVEMKQIGARQEAGRIGGIGACGRELCCSAWMSSFVSITTGAARAQDISLNPQKLAGQCSKLKCCFIYEYDSYVDARRTMPRVTAPLQIFDAEYYLIKSDVLAGTMSFATNPHSTENFTTIPAERVREIQRLNAKGQKPDRLEGEHINKEREQAPKFIDSAGEESITRFDRKQRSSNGNNHLRNGNNNRASSDRSKGTIGHGCLKQSPHTRRYKRLKARRNHAGHHRKRGFCKKAFYLFAAFGHP